MSYLNRICCLGVVFAAALRMHAAEINVFAAASLSAKGSVLTFDTNSFVPTSGLPLDCPWIAPGRAGSEGTLSTGCAVSRKRSVGPWTK
jgi:hypothetical protein